MEQFIRFFFAKHFYVLASQVNYSLSTRVLVLYLTMRYLMLLLLLAVLTGKAQNLENTLQQLQQDHDYAAIIDLLENQDLSADHELILVKAYLQTGQTSKAITRLNGLWVTDTTNTKVAIALGESYYERSQFRQAYPFFVAATKLDSTNGYYHKLAGQCALKIDALQIKAISHYIKALELEPNDRNAAYQLATAFLNLDGVKDARGITQLFVKNDSTDIGMMKLEI